VSRIADLASQLAAPIIAAPMFLVSNPALTLAVCSQGLVGSFPAHSTRSREQLVQWLDEVDDGISALKKDRRDAVVAPYAVNLVMHASNPRMAGDLDLVVEREVPIVITSKSAPGVAVQRIHDYGGMVISDIATQRHAQKCAQAGVDAVIAVCAGAGGHTGRINPFALMNEIKEVYDGSIILGHKQMILDSLSTDIFYTAAMDGAPANFLAPSLTNAGIDLAALAVTRPGEVIAASDGQRRWSDVWSAGHGVGSIHDVPQAVELCQRLVSQFDQAKHSLRDRLGG